MKKLIGFCLWFSLPALANVIPAEPHIYVEGYAEQLVYPDQAPGGKPFLKSVQ